MNKQVLLGMSGGIDSFVSALLLKEQGYDVVGVTFQFYGEEADKNAQMLANDISIKHITKDLRKIFKSNVIDGFTSAYLNAKTPSPCSWCNRTMKWHQLALLADELSIPYIATGHYVRIEKVANHHHIFQGVDEAKDQSYFLWELDEKILSRAMTPLGDYTKEQVRNLAIENGFRQMARKKESMGVCFLQGRNYRTFLQQELVSNWKKYAFPGKVFDENSNHVGTHTGLPNYTVGQKRDIELFSGKPGGYVKHMDTTTNAITIAPKPALLKREFFITQVSFRNPDDLTENKGFTVKVRGLGLNPEGLGKIKQVDEDTWCVSLDSPAWAIAPAQPVVFYDGQRLVGGGLAK